MTKTGVADIIVDGRHPHSSLVQEALRTGRERSEPMPTMMARAVRAVLDVDADMTVCDAFRLVDELWLR